MQGSTETITSQLASLDKDSAPQEYAFRILKSHLGLEMANIVVRYLKTPGQFATDFQAPAVQERLNNLQTMKENKRVPRKLTEKAAIAKFVDAVTSKNYSSAHKYLVGIVDKKLKKQINSQLDKPLF